jgi:hypothetical protein
LRVALRRFVKLCAACFALLLIVIAIFVATSWHCDLRGQLPPSATAEKDPAVTAAAAKIKDYARPEDDAYLGYPEWYIVWSYQEKADYQEHHLPSGFPFFAAVRQYWSSYCCISKLIRGKYPYNAGEQVMLVVIGSSFSAEYILKGAYEETIGRLTEWISGGEQVAEDRYAYHVARDYADFVHIRPFYEFRFAPRVAGLWRDTPLWGPHLIRKWERKLFLSADYAFEAFYCEFIQVGTHLTYGYEPAETYAAIDHADEAFVRGIPHVKIIEQTGPGVFIVDIPRYQEFTAVAQAMAQQGIRFTDIAGSSQITLSVLVPTRWNYDATDAHELFAQPVLTAPGTHRVVMGCNVTDLSAVIGKLRADKIPLEHIYDY